jgi:soluble lytic murein transglycosylase-like protein
MRKNKIYYRLLAGIFLYGLLQVQILEYHKSLLRQAQEEQTVLEAELNYLRTKTEPRKNREQTITKIRDILARFKRQLKHDPTEIARTIFETSREHDVDPLLVLGIIKTESDFFRYAVSPKGARGLMQLSPHTGMAVAREKRLHGFTTGKLYDGRLNIELGVHYLAKLIDSFGDLRVALEAYNRGPTAVRKTLRNGREIRGAYAAKVLGNYKKFSEQYLAM